MSERQFFRLVHAEARRRAAQACQESAEGSIVTIQPASRTISQNAAQWPLLEAFAAQLEWPVNGRMVKLDADDWKNILTAAFQGETVSLAMGLNGGVVMLGLKTSKFGKKRFGEWLEFLHATAVDRGVNVYAVEVA